MMIDDGEIAWEGLLPGVELTNGNDGQGRAWYSSANRRKQYEKALRFKGLSRTPFGFPVAVTVTRILGKGQRLWDSSSIARGNYKQIEDALVALGWFTDDSPKYITETDFRQDASRRGSGPAVRIEIRRAGDPFARQPHGTGGFFKENANDDRHE